MQGSLTFGLFLSYMWEQSSTSVNSLKICDFSRALKLSRRPAGSPSTRVICAVYFHLVFNFFFFFLLVKMTLPIHFLHFKNTLSHQLRSPLYCRCLCDFQMSGNHVFGLLICQIFLEDPQTPPPPRRRRRAYHRGVPATLT
jgi:hypothetical protein